MLVQVVELTGDDILLLVDHQDVMLTLIGDKLLLRLLDLCAQLSQLCGEKFSGTICGFVARANVVIDKRIDEGIHDSGVQIAIATRKAHVNHSRVLNRLHR